MRPPVRVMETVSRVAPLGVSFRDDATGNGVADGLQVSAYPEGQPALRREARVNRAGVHILMDLPGLRSLEFGAGDAEYWSSLSSERKPFIVEVRDALGRFLPFSFRAELPHRGPFSFEPGSPPSGIPSVPLFSAPSRQAASTLATLRAELWDPEASSPAAWALVEATPANRSPVRGLADAQGRVALFFPYPPPVEVIDAVKSPVLPTTRPLLEQEWTVRLRVLYAPRAPTEAPPDLDDTLSQPAASVGPDTSQWQPYVERTLRYGQELVVRTQDEPRSRLWIKPVGSPP